MADNILEREYVIPLRRSWTNTPRYKKSFKSVKTIKEFIARHMRVPDRDLNKVKLDVHLNNEVWFRGSKNPPIKVKVKARKEGDIVFVELAQTPDVVKFNKAKLERRHKEAEKKESPKEKAEDKKESKAEDGKKSEEEKKTENEKAKSEEIINEKAAQQEAKVQKHTLGGMKKEPKIQRKALKK
jgi:large subunit ribosomal protein L31e